MPSTAKPPQPSAGFISAQFTEPYCPAKRPVNSSRSAGSSSGGKTSPKYSRAASIRPQWGLPGSSRGISFSACSSRMSMSRARSAVSPQDRTWLFPFWFSGTSKAGDPYAALFPIHGSIREMYWERIGFTLFPLWVTWDRNDSHTWSVLWPFVQRQKGPKRDAVLLNAGASLYIGRKAASMKEGVVLAGEIIDSGKALQTLEKFIEVSNRPEA